MLDELVVADLVVSNRLFVLLVFLIQHSQPQIANGRYLVLKTVQSQQYLHSSSEVLDFLADCDMVADVAGAEKGEGGLLCFGEGEEGELAVA